MALAQPKDLRVSITVSILMVLVAPAYSQITYFSSALAAGDWLSLIPVIVIVGGFGWTILWVLITLRRVNALEFLATYEEVKPEQQLPEKTPKGPGVAS